MGNIGKVFIAILAIFLLLGAFRTSIADGIKGWRTETQIQTASLTTGAGETSGNVTLTGDLFQDDTAEVTTISSNETLDSAVASSYDTTTNKLLVAGLASDKTRSLTITYSAESENDVMRVIGPFLGFLIFGGFLAAIIIGIFKKGKRG